VRNALTPVITTLQCGPSSSGLAACGQITARGDTGQVRTAGRNYTSQSVVWVNGSARPTVFNSESQLTATLSPATVAGVG